MVELTNPSALQPRSLPKMVVFFIITFGLYGIYWIHQVNKQLAAATDDNYSPIVRTLLGFVVIGIWQTSHTAEAVVDQDGVVLFLLWLVFSPAAWYLISAGINEHAQRA